MPSLSLLHLSQLKLWRTKTKLKHCLNSKLLSVHTAELTTTLDVSEEDTSRLGDMQKATLSSIRSTILTLKSKVSAKTQETFKSLRKTPLDQRTLRQSTQTTVALRTALQDGPVAATIRAGSRVFRDYANGILESKSCTSAFPDHEYDHGVLVIGYGQTILGLPYFLVKNSFGKSWGNQGYAMISAADNGEVGGTCGILNNLYQPIITTKNVNSKYNVQQSMF